MLDARFLDALGEIRARLDALELNRAVTGSVGLSLQGLPVSPIDIDIQTDRAGAYAVERCLAAQSVRPVRFATAELIRSHFGAFELHGIQVEIMGDLACRLPDGGWEAPLDLARHKHYVAAADMRLPVLPLDHEYRTYLRRGKIEKAELIRTWLRSAANHE